MNTEELKRLAEAATPGPWEAWPVGDYPPLFTVSTVDGLGLFTTTTEAENETEFAAVFQDEDAAYIAAANPVAVLELIRQRDELLAALSIFMEVIDRPPEASCSCHISPPCNDCVENFGLREAFSFADAAIAKAEG